MIYNNCQNSVFNDNLTSAIYRNASYKLKPNDVVFADSKNGELSFILPANPELGDKIVLFDHSNTWNINNVTIINNTKKILGRNENLILNINNYIVLLIYYNSQWNVFTIPGL